MSGHAISNSLVRCRGVGAIPYMQWLQFIRTPITQGFLALSLTPQDDTRSRTSTRTNHSSLFLIILPSIPPAAHKPVGRPAIIDWLGPSRCGDNLLATYGSALHFLGVESIANVLFQPFSPPRVSIWIFVILDTSCSCMHGGSGI